MVRDIPSLPHSPLAGISPNRQGWTVLHPLETEERTMDGGAHAGNNATDARASRTQAGERRPVGKAGLIYESMNSLRMTMPSAGSVVEMALIHVFNQMRRVGVSVTPMRTTTWIPSCTPCTPRTLGCDFSRKKRRDSFPTVFLGGVEREGARGRSGSRDERAAGLPAGIGIPGQEQRQTNGTSGRAEEQWGSPPSIP